MERSIDSWWSTTFFLPPTPSNNVDIHSSALLNADSSTITTFPTSSSSSSFSPFSPSSPSSPSFSSSSYSPSSSPSSFLSSPSSSSPFYSSSTSPSPFLLQSINDHYYSTLPTTLSSKYYYQNSDEPTSSWASTPIFYASNTKKSDSIFSLDSVSDSGVYFSKINTLSTNTLSTNTLSTKISYVTASTLLGSSSSLLLPDTIDDSLLWNNSLASILPQNFTTVSPDFADDHNIYILPLYQQIIWTIVFGLMIFVAAGGNLIVIWIVLNNKRMRTVTNYFLVNLSLADIMVSTLNVIFNFIYMLHGHWPFGQAYCKISNFIAILSVAASVFTLMAISIDRYLAIVHPLRPRMSRSTTLNIIVIVWIASSLLALPNILYSTTFDESFANGDTRVVCYLVWHDGPSNKSKIEYVYNIVILLVTYMLPIVSMIYTYFRVGRELWGSQSIGECTAKQMESIKSKRKIVKMMMIVVAIFGICWAPYHSYFLLVHHYPAINDSTYAQQFYLAIYWLAMSNSMYNPFVYCWMNSRFRQGFRNVFCCVCCCPKDASHMYEKPRAYHLATRYTSNPGSEAGLAATSDTRVRFNGNGNAVTLQQNSCADLAVMSNTVTGSSATSPMVHSRYVSPLNREML